MKSVSDWKKVREAWLDSQKLHESMAEEAEYIVKAIDDKINSFPVEEKDLNTK